ncbi:MAG TPA: hypothetical protein DCO77_07160 [Nitrospiraceae bacterium]|nr:hypothetical protein [Nitrospiraceae bacterium]
MTIADELTRLSSVFIDTAPIIYYIEAHPLFGPPTKEIVETLPSRNISAYSSVVTLTEVLPKPIETGNEILAKKFVEYLEHGAHLTLLEITTDIAKEAGTLRGHYADLRALDAIQIATALDIKADAFLTNDKKLKKIKEIRVLVLQDYA